MARPQVDSQAVLMRFARKFPQLLQIQGPKGKVELLEVIGKGNYGNVYKARLTATNDITAVKVVELKEEELRETLLEMEILRDCAHPNIVRFMGLFIKALDLWICMEFCGGGALDSIYRGIKKPLTEDVISVILYETLRGLDYLHTKAHTIHRDIKAGNLFMTEGGEVKLGDFGVSAKLKQPGDRARTFIGTPYWMAPEVIACEPDGPTYATASYDSKADVWSIGITAIEIAEKNPPLSEIHPMRAMKLIPQMQELGFAKPKVFTREFRDFVAQCLIRDPARRPSAAQLLNHEFFAKARAATPQKRQEILADLVRRYRRDREAAKSGKRPTDDEDEQDPFQNFDGPAVQVAPSAPPVVPAEPRPQFSSPIPGQLVAQAEFRVPVNGMPHATVPTPVDPRAQRQSIPPAPDSSNEKRLLYAIPLGDSRIPAEINTGDLIGPFFVFGTDKGLYFIDINQPQDQQKAIAIIQDVRFRQISVLEDYGVMLALSGRNDHVRQYKLRSIKRLIQLRVGQVCGKAAADEAGIALRLKPDKPAAATAEDEDDPYSRVNLQEQSHLTSADMVDQWANDYIKIVGSKSCKMFVVERTQQSVHLLALVATPMAGNTAVWYEWAVDPYLKFLKVKDFWLPESPKSISLLHDGVFIKQLFLAYNLEGDLIQSDDAQVVELPVTREFTENMGKFGAMTNPRWQSWSQIPFSDAVKQKIGTLIRPNSTINKKIRAAMAPTAGAGKKSLEEVQRVFLATFSNVSRIVDVEGKVVDTQTLGYGGPKGYMIKWSEPPSRVVLVPEHYVAAVCSETVEVALWKTGTIVQVMKAPKGEAMRFLCQNRDMIFVAAGGRARGWRIQLMTEVGGKMASNGGANGPAH
ncbi:kinase-like protein [Gonapodya prolifera JEL478]|uniref:non-specific serine/threonine protein kinase n=1 Tax=Gonapodya prolifera (strain JEL478) TaxID=1344416 RepID=A0A139AMV8_GONPJ|nr:kinase-like protein [Gonapodya prolifera JEL478]|eukprot:KXS18097.1 kinase-like protein [Gonapodya prolifera JEL478]